MHSVHMKQDQEKSEIWAMEHAARERAVIERIRSEVKAFLAKRGLFARANEADLKAFSNDLPPAGQCNPIPEG